MPTNPILESFSWYVKQAFDFEPVGQSKARIKGKAAEGDVVSKNQRHYVREELKRAARTWIGKPINVNHDDHKIVGHVEWMEYDDDGLMEYIGVVDKEPYNTLVRTRSPSIKGVSIQASYLYNVCSRCNRKFHTEEDFKHHMIHEEFIRNFTYEPRGVKGDFLSLVVSPEVPGIDTTSVELMETYQLPQLLETVARQAIERETYMEKLQGKAAVSNVPTIAAIPSDGIRRVATNDAPVAVTPAPPVPEPSAAPTPPPVQEESKPQEPPVAPIAEARAAKPPLKRVDPPKLEKVNLLYGLSPLKEKLSLGEPFGGYTDFADCVAQNQDKENPEAYCGQIKHQTEGEMLRHMEVNSALGTLKEAIAALNANVTAIHDYTQKALTGLVEYLDALPSDDTTWKQTVHELKASIAALPTDDLGWKEQLAAIKPYDDKPLKDEVDALKKRSADEFAVYKKDLLEYWKPELDKAKAELAGIKAQQAKETQDLTTRVDNLEDKVKPAFKGKAVTPKAAATEYYEDPITQPAKRKEA